MKEMIQVKKAEAYRECLVCSDGTKAAKVLTFRTGSNSWTSLSYCEKHFEQLKAELLK